jgi:hypothetical protein
LIEKLASLTPVHGALDQIVQRFGTDMVAEVTGRSRRIIRKRGEDGVDRLVVENALAPPISARPWRLWTTSSASSSFPTQAAPSFLSC